MRDAIRSAPLSVGDEIAGLHRAITVERLRRYSIGVRSAARGEYTPPGVNIHTDEAFAKNQGLAAPIGDGMIVTNYCSNMLLNEFGRDYLLSGELRTKFIKPTLVGDVITPRGKVLAVHEDSGQRTYEFGIWCDNQDGLKIVDGDAKVTVPIR